MRNVPVYTVQHTMWDSWRVFCCNWSGSV